MYVAGHYLHDRRVQERSSLNNTIRAAYDSHAALEHGKEIGRLGEHVGIPSAHYGTIGGEAPSVSAIVEGDAAAPASE